jgi:hypothetical protein
MPESAYILRAIAERALSRRYMRARVSTVYGYDEYGVTVPGRAHEARVRSLSRGFHQVGDVVVLAAINGDPQLLVILDAVGVTGSTSSPYPPLPPTAEPLWPCAGGTYDRTGLLGLSATPSSLTDDIAWDTAVTGLGIVGVARGLSIASDCIVLRQDVRRGSASAVVRCLELDASSIRWEIAQTSDDPHDTTGSIVHDGYWYGGCTTAAGSGLHKIALADGAISWVCPYFQGPYRSLTIHAGRLYAIRGYRTDCRYCEIDMASGSIVVERARTHYGLGDYLTDGSRALASDGTYLVGMRQDTATAQSGSAQIIVMDADLQPLRTIEMRDATETVVSYQPIPRLREGLVWTCGGTYSEGGGWVRAWDLSSGLRSVNVIVRRGILGAQPCATLMPAEDHVAVWQPADQDLGFNPPETYQDHGVTRTYTWGGASIAEYRSDEIGTNAPGTDARMWVQSVRYNSFGIFRGPGPYYIQRETSGGTQTVTTTTMPLDVDEPIWRGYFWDPYMDRWGGDLALAGGRAYYHGIEATGPEGTMASISHLRRMT